MTLMMRRGLAVLGLALCCAGAAQAHPHVWVDARSTVLFEDGALAGIRHEWTFDPYFSAWAIQGLDTDGDGVLAPAEMQELAEENMVGLAYYEFYTYAGADEEALGLQGPHDPSMRYENEQTTLSYTVWLEQPREISGEFDIIVGDPEYYSEITFPNDSAVTVEGAPAGCSAQAHPPQMIDPALEEQLYLLGPDVLELPPELKQAARDLANRITITCPQRAAATASDAIAQAISAPAPRPFAAPPSEPAMAPGQGGFMGWVADQQRTFYRALTDALSALREDNNAFWILGGLSFLYGILHAAGPGHGKVVISSYVVANERQLRRGIVLSFLSAMMQAVVAVAFVLVAVGLLRATSVAMSDAAGVMTRGSYVLVAVLGAWLAARHILGFGHHHHHAEHRHAHADHRHGHDGHDDRHDGHDEHAHHVVLPQQTGGNWRSMAGVVFSVGIRPCSGALVVLVFALTQGVLAAGIAATFLMALGTAITVGVLATLALGAKGLMMRYGGGGAVAGVVLWWVELAGALAVMGFGLLLFFATP
ncbi:DUF1007 family protein [Pelagibacterium xiamenense]|uniref:HoxN/HupN/NixA family nickel/cobalt transporter n=1 Tax=Pelagibacterium xiamenense TaxID=2901140 RepID=UPI001E59A899|nr:DUF1007 family protein [Pelagibacterium xiamenense]MCD7060547.1 DUF1007 family protein [Pelagibacterium xiamenense]